MRLLVFEATLLHESYVNQLYIQENLKCCDAAFGPQ